MMEKCKNSSMSHRLKKLHSQRKLNYNQTLNYYYIEVILRPNPTKQNDTIETEIQEMAEVH